MGRALGLDVGTKTIGVAVSDPLGISVRPVCTLRRKGVRQDVERLAPIAREQEVETLVVGLPLELDGEEGRSARLARQVGDALGEALDLAPVYVDERYSSVDAERVLVEADFSRKKRKKVIDQAAAILILQSWLEHGNWSQT
jgi:putative Holliday junction resolvase